jgi:hypothetical protein
MPLFAIQWGLIVTCALSSVTGLSGAINPKATIARFFGDSFPNGDLFQWNTKMQFLSLLVVYSLNIIVALSCPYANLAYMLAAGNMIRVIWIVVNFLTDAEKLAYMGFKEDGKMLKIICGVQSVLAVVIVVCAYVSSTNPDYQVMIDALEAPGDFGPYTYFVYFFCGVGILGRIPQVIMVKKAMARFMKNGEEGLPTDKGEIAVLEFSFGFTALNFLLIWSFMLAIFFATPTVFPIALFMLILCGPIFMPQMVWTLVNLDSLGFALPPMIFFLLLLAIMFGASLLQVFL